MKSINCTEIQGVSSFNLNLKFQLSLDYSSYYKIENFMKFLSSSLLVKSLIIESVRNKINK